jgi:hypothetical protein
MKESVLRAAAIASLALALIISITTWIGLSTSSQRGSFFVGFFEFALILFLGVVAWALFNSLADIATVRNHVEVLNVRLGKIEEALGVEVPVMAPPARGADTAGRRGGTAPSTQPEPGTDAPGSDDEHPKEGA